ncbi:Msa1p Ecym_4052 [Eremothecium cymbalariae DBVPG|uniref:Uncharacterized protein n=1 Tax=Eremothecium cymbalariae (strain CBS 270.75 / DBVPG 7215 / KCTC 17166 / NRRL Y-17582) TaxID=931890 RepID=G8JSY0_ERECY|nr:hypothetical protein Ecym_4052 [Eremothecium cymbalariae DBVPG\
MSQSQTTTPRKRGRPTILKDYADPMKSPMAYSSLQVQKSNQCFNKPLMRIAGAGNTSPVKFKTPVTKNVTDLNASITFIDESSPPSSADSVGSGGKTSKFRGIVINTPKKSTASKSSGSGQESSPLTPLDNVFSSVSRAQLSSPPGIMHEDYGSPLKKRRTSVRTRPVGTTSVAANKGEADANKATSANSRTTSSAAAFKFFLSIDNEGKACISDSRVSIGTTGHGSGSASGAGTGNPLVDGCMHSCNVLGVNAATGEGWVSAPAMKFDKRRVLGLLKQMSKKSGISTAPSANPLSAFIPISSSASTSSLGSNITAASAAPITTTKMTTTNTTSNINNKKHQNKSNEVYSSDFPPCSPPPPPNSSAIPLTPRCTSVFQFKTGFTPCNISIDELLRSPQVKSAGADRFLISSVSTPAGNAATTVAAAAAMSAKQDHFVFKLSSGDPLLMNDEDSELLAHVSNDPAEMQHILNSPRRPVCFNTPPSWVNVSSPPRSSSMMKSDGQIHTSSVILSKIDEQPSTPGVPLNESAPVFQYTPIIQQAMSGAFSKQHLLPDVAHEKVQITNLSSNDKGTAPIEHDDARLALKKLIKG